MSLPLASATRIGPVEFISVFDDDLARPVLPVGPEPLPDEDPEAFEERALVFKQECEAYEKASQAFHRRMKAARETQSWDDVLKPEADPVIFVCKPIEYEAMEALEGERRHLESDLAMAGLLLRMSLVEIRGPAFAGFKVPPLAPHTRPDPDTKRAVVTGIGKVAPPSMLKDIARRVANGELAKAVIRDIGLQILNHWERAPVP